MIDSKKVLQLFKENNISTTDIRKNKILGESTLQRLRKGNVTLNVDAMNHLCALFQCQPSDLLTYVPDEESEAWAAEIWKSLKKQ